MAVAGPPATDGTGGLLIIYSRYFINNGNIESKGSKGGIPAPNVTNYAYPGSGGGSSGGGSINIFYHNITNIGTINADGGIAVQQGSKGGNGSITNKKYKSMFYISKDSNTTFITNGQLVQYPSATYDNIVKNASLNISYINNNLKLLTPPYKIIKMK